MGAATWGVSGTPIGDKLLMGVPVTPSRNGDTH